MDVIFPSTAWNGHAIPPETHYDPVYWHNNNSFEITTTNKLAQDKPTLTWNIPVENLGITVYTKTVADFCLREFQRYIDSLNAAIYNRSRTDSENGKYIIYTPTAEILKRNTVGFAMC